MGTEDASFTRLLPRDLRPFAAVAQTLDNQWVPRGLLTRMIDEGLSLDDVRAEREAVVRTEYLRAVLNAEQLVVNRMYFFNNPAVIRDFAQPGPGREAFRALLGSGVLVPFLYAEDSPIDNDAGSRISGLTGWAPWLEVARETEMSCVRLAWQSSEANRNAIARGLNKRFHEFVMSLQSKCYDGGDQVFASHLGLPPDRATALGARLSDAAAWAFHADHWVMREDFYTEFVVDGKPAEGRYSRSKRFAGELKQLIDLAYNTSLPETLDRYPLRPEDSLNRSALQEWTPRTERQEKPLGEAEILEQLVIRRTAFDLATNQLVVPPLGDLGLTDIVQARGTDEWHAYMAALADVVGHPETFESGAQALQRTYSALLERLARIAGDNRRGLRFTTGFGFNLDFAGVLLKVRWFGGRLFYRQVGTPPSQPQRTRGMSRVVVSGDDVETQAARRGGHLVAVDLKPFDVEDPVQFLREAVGQLEAAGARRVDRGPGSRDGGLERDLGDEAA
ncbi:hypothetical protein JIG36_32315 [Actinoplanes sp. LDG1-06]|uniref:Uncharacterized protein n=1 Tax=Paractinoplanes ovalisporus TaxID=2810368 RepID=A0ABS2AKA5_9ACTN|nr:hypothetical protein [Actinoplanes ovalisporus]MBM2620210.1 hypothetical protein [Actinoplanes ovalisporus]